MWMEELVVYRNQVQVEATSTRKEIERPNFNKTSEEGRRDQSPREPRYTYYTPLSVSISHILDQALAIEILAMPKKDNTPPKA